MHTSVEGLLATEGARPGDQCGLGVKGQGWHSACHVAI